MSACHRVLMMTDSWLSSTWVMTDVSVLQYILQAMVRLCDNHLAQKAGINSDPGKFPTYLQVRMREFIKPHIAIYVSHCSETMVCFSLLG